MIRDLDAPRDPALVPGSEPTQVEVDEGFSHWTADLSRVLHHALTFVAGALFIIPLLWMIGASLRQRGLAPPTTIEWIPNPISFANYPEIFRLLPLWDYMVNSIRVVGLAVPITVLTASWAGFAIAQLAPRPRNWLIALSFATLMVPVTALWITRFIIYKWLGVLDTHWALVLPSVMGTSPFYVLLFYWAFTRIPGELFEAARLEGAGAFRVWRSIGMPLVRPAITAVAVLSFVFYWSNFLDPLLYLSSQDKYTLPTGLRALQQMLPTDFPLMMAGAVFITLPILLIFIFAQRYFLQDINDGGSESPTLTNIVRRRRAPTALPVGQTIAYCIMRIAYYRSQVTSHALRITHYALRIKRSLPVALRLFVTFTTLLTLTMTIMQREDRDGYQATHLFFMPRSSWEMDEGRGMLYEEEYYYDVDMEELAEEWLGEYREYEEDEEGYGATAGGSTTTGPAMRRAPHPPNLQGNEMPVQEIAGVSGGQGSFFYVADVPRTMPQSWIGEVPTPPPRSRFPS